MAKRQFVIQSEKRSDLRPLPFQEADTADFMTGIDTQPGDTECKALNESHAPAKAVLAHNPPPSHRPRARASSFPPEPVQPAGG